MNAVAAATFSASGERRKLVATFFDNHGRTASAQVELGLSCRSKYSIDGGPVGACDGQCAETRADHETCGDSCTKCPSNQACVNGKCSSLTALPSCFAATALDPQTGTCAAVCTAKSGTNCQHFEQGPSCPVPSDIYDDCNTHLSYTPAFGPFVTCVCNL